MAVSKRLLLVEGVNDKSFYEQFCRAHGMHADVKIAPAREVGGTHNSKQGAIRLLSVLLKQLEDADAPLERLGLVLDADRTANGGGFVRTVDQVAAELISHDFTPVPVVLPTGGLLFQHNDGLPDVGLWVMPNNQDDGILEDWIFQSALVREQALLDHATATVAALAAPKFRPVQRRKAEVATWMAWQDQPGEGLYYAIKGGMLEPASPLYSGLKAWMARVFQ
ncbi:MAG: DUF3226 domain-containing protein [Pseudomonadota bacterium]